ncbi:hypothetical protein [Streptomyces turgidiscabies]|uniref:RecB family endonuclease NucS n=1 Tax=Streptomyces turgidiscabies TaxID=85558 RepID=A0ABU0RNN6_9ACTN|nr:RecB family endonuclease NucS [Streptomyces turgidiscabies]
MRPDRHRPLWSEYPLIGIDCLIQETKRTEESVNELKLFRIADGQASEIPGAAVALERQLQTLIERNMEAMLGIRFLASEHGTGSRHRGRIDSLGLDENGNPVIVEFTDRG